MPRNPNRPILAIDPGTRELGYAVLARNRLLDHGVIPLRPLPKEQRLQEATRGIGRLVDRHRPGALVLEKTYRHPVPWLNDLHRITLAARRIAKAWRIKFHAYSPQAVRQTTAGNGKASKAEAAVHVAHRFPQLRLLLTQDRRWKERYWLNGIDAAALAWHHQHLTNQPPSRSRRSG
jgi:Holliday junction resolvasome RuvABC endonuclease subunit